MDREPGGLKSMGHKELDLSERLDNNNSFILNLYHFSVPVPCCGLFGLILLRTLWAS